MVLGKKVVVVMPAYNAAQTLEKTHGTLDFDIVDEVVLVDDCSTDATKEISKRLDIQTVVHLNNKGYGGNQKTCYQTALNRGADIVVMVHPDYQYEPRLVAPMAYMIATGTYDCVLGSRILGGTAIKGGMPVYKYIANRFLTAAQNFLMGQKISEYHTGLRAFSKEILETLPLGENDDDFIFDNEMLAQILYLDFKIGEVSCPTKYFDEASSINFSRSVKYGLGVLRVSFLYFLNKRGLLKTPIFYREGTRLTQLTSDAHVFHSRG